MSIRNILLGLFFIGFISAAHAQDNCTIDIEATNNMTLSKDEITVPATCSTIIGMTEHLVDLIDNKGDTPFSGYNIELQIDQKCKKTEALEYVMSALAANPHCSQEFLFSCCANAFAIAEKAIKNDLNTTP